MPTASGPQRLSPTAAAEEARCSDMALSLMATNRAAIEPFVSWNNQCGITPPLSPSGVGKPRPQRLLQLRLDTVQGFCQHYANHIWKYK
mmetsp:Transcript_10972/g.32891  ORF Transcript_10972/g.32891 Transcript_10972/m.32891 type:complete len:89 (-) Transcript_10972:2258-2524(-)